MTVGDLMKLLVDQETSNEVVMSVLGMDGVEIQEVEDDGDSQTVLSYRQTTS